MRHFSYIDYLESISNKKGLKISAYNRKVLIERKLPSTSLLPEVLYPFLTLDIVKFKKQEICLLASKGRVSYIGIENNVQSNNVYDCWIHDNKVCDIGFINSDLSCYLSFFHLLHSFDHKYYVPLCNKKEIVKSEIRQDYQVLLTSLKTIDKLGYESSYWQETLDFIETEYWEEYLYPRDFR